MRKVSYWQSNLSNKLLFSIIELLTFFFYIYLSNFCSHLFIQSVLDFFPIVSSTSAATCLFALVHVPMCLIKLTILWDLKITFHVNAQESNWDFFLILILANINEAIGFVTFLSIEFRGEVGGLAIKVVCAVWVTLIREESSDIDDAIKSAFLCFFWLYLIAKIKF